MGGGLPKSLARMERESVHALSTAMSLHVKYEQDLSIAAVLQYYCMILVLSTVYVTIYVPIFK